MPSGFCSHGSTSPKPTSMIKRLSRSYTRSLSVSREIDGDNRGLHGYFEEKRCVPARKSATMGKIDRSGRYVQAKILK